MNTHKISIFAGHVGKDSGAVVNSNGHCYIESVITHSIATIIEDTLKNIGYDAVLVEGNFKDRIQISKNSKIGVSIHCNTSEDEKLNGQYCIHYPNSVKGEDLSYLISDSLRDAGIKQTRTPAPRSDLYILNKTKFPVSLVECGFLSNSEDAIKLNTEGYQYYIAFSITNGILKYLKSEGL